MSLHLLAPDNTDTCCGCGPSVCAPCALCPTGPSVALVLSGLSACCTGSNQRLLGLGSLNGTHTLTEIAPGSYFRLLSGILTRQNYLSPGCTVPGSSTTGLDAAIEFICFDDFAELQILTSPGGTVLFYDAIDAPATQGDPFAFSGIPSCTALQPFTFGGTATVTP